VAGRIPIVAVGVPACGVKGRLARLLHRKRARTSRSGDVRGSEGVGSAACVRGREAVDRSMWNERKQPGDRLGLRGPGALAAPRTSDLARRVRWREAGARSNANAGWYREGVSKSRQWVGGRLVIVSRCLLHSPLRSTGEWRRQRWPWWPERLTGGAPVAPPRRIRRAAWQERCPAVEVVKEKSGGFWRRVAVRDGS
jgi:hypothetical protein